MAHAPRLNAVAAVALTLAAAGLSAQEAKSWTQAPPELSSLSGFDYRDAFPDASVSAETAQLLNSRGFAAYRHDDLVQAARLFRAAWEMDPEHAYAHYNYAAVLAIFAQGFTHFDAKPAKLHSLSFSRTERILAYREAIFGHLKESIALREERLERLQEDSDFATIRELEEYDYLLMGRNPSMAEVVRRSPVWYSIQAGAFLPNDTLELRPDFTVRYSYDTRRFEIFPEVDFEGDQSFTGRYRVDGDRLIIFPDGSPEVYYGTISVKLDELGFVERKSLQLDCCGSFSDLESHYWEGQDA